MALLMLYAVAVAALVGLAAAGIEGALRLYHLSSRWVWVGALAVSLAAPYLGPRLVATGANTPAGVPRPEVSLAITPATTPMPQHGRAGAEWLGRIVATMRALDRPARLFCLASSGAALALVLVAGLALARRRATWQGRQVDGRDVLIAPDTGPALVGFRRGAIVLPHWALDFEASFRDFMLRHEEEHQRAGDQYLMLLGVAALVFMPWNPAVWRQVRRLRLALELDCDARVLRARPDVGGYGVVLLHVARRAAGLPLVPAFAEGRSLLERRIRSMTSQQTKTKHRTLKASAMVAAAALGLAVACEVPAPAAPEVAEPNATRFRAPDGTVVELANPGEVEAAVAAQYPSTLRKAGIGGRVDVWVTIDGDGRVVGRRIDRSSGEGPLDLAAIRVAEVMRFRPVANLGDSVSVPVTFGVPRTPEELFGRIAADFEQTFARAFGRPLTPEERARLHTAIEGRFAYVLRERARSPR